jgi:hypothetical protein
VTRRFLIAIAGFCAVGCLTTVQETPPLAYHNPLDVIDAGVPPLPDSGSPPQDGGGLPPGPDGTAGSVASQTPQFVSATYQVLTTGGPARTLVYLADVNGLCALSQDGGLGPSWNLLRLHLAGDTPASYSAASVLPPNGATAEFDFQDMTGAYGLVGAVSGTVQLDSVDPANTQTARGTYTLDFSDAGALRGRFTADPCPAVPPPPGG